MLKIAGFQPVNPAEEQLPDGSTWADYMRHDIKLLCDCDGIYMLNGWREKAGAIPTKPAPQNLRIYKTHKLRIKRRGKVF